MSIRQVITVGSLWLIGASQGFQATTPAPAVTVGAIDDKKYCMGQPNGTVDNQGPDAITLRLKIRLSYRNLSQRPLILPIDGKLTALIVRTRPDETKPEDRFAVRLKPRQDAATELPVGISTENPFSPWFKVISPKGEVDKYFGEYVVLCVHNPSLPDRRSELLGSRIRLQLEITHAGLSQSLANRLGRRWMPFRGSLDRKGDIGAV